MLFFLIALSTLCSGQVVYLKFEYKTSNSDDFYNQKFLVKIPDSLSTYDNPIIYLLKNKYEFLTLINDYNKRIYYSETACEELVLNNGNLYTDTTKGTFDSNIFLKYIELENQIDKTTYNDTLVLEPESGSIMKIGLISLHNLKTKRVNLMGRFGQCMLYKLRDDESVSHTESFNECKSNIIFLE